MEVWSTKKGRLDQVGKTNEQSLPSPTARYELIITVTAPSQVLTVLTFMIKSKRSALAVSITSLSRGIMGHTYLCHGLCWIETYLAFSAVIQNLVAI
jgi:hypothetical protein